KKGLRLNGLKLEVVTLGENGMTEKDLLVHDEKQADPTLATMLSRLSYPAFPEPMGVLRDVERPTYDGLMVAQNEEVLKKKGPGTRRAARGAWGGRGRRRRGGGGGGVFPPGGARGGKNPRRSSGHDSPHQISVRRSRRTG